jgi:hypothetical protein
VWEVLTEWEGKRIVLAFFLVVAIKSNLSTIEAAKVQNNSECGMRNVEYIFIVDG